MKLERDNSVSRSLQLSTLAIPREVPDVLGMKSTSPPASPALPAASHLRVFPHTRAFCSVHVSLFMFLLCFVIFLLLCALDHIF